MSISEFLMVPGSLVLLVVLLVLASWLESRLTTESPRLVTADLPVRPGRRPAA